MTEQQDEYTTSPGTAADLIAFLDNAGTKGWINPVSAKALRTATFKIMSIDTDWPRIDVRDLDLEEQFSRFVTLRRNNYSDASLKNYKSRLNQSVSMYLARLRGDTDWKIHGPRERGSGAPKPSKNGTKPTTPTKPVERSAEPQAVPPTLGTEATAPDRPVSAAPARKIDHRFPLRDDFDAVVTLPRDLKAEEAEWLAEFIKTLARPASPTVS